MIPRIRRKNFFLKGNEEENLKVTSNEKQWRFSRIEKRGGREKTPGVRHGKRREKEREKTLALRF